MNNTINLNKYRELLKTWWWDCNTCGKSNKEDVVICCEYSCNDRPLYTKVTKEILKELLTTNNK